ncbi:adenylosuccinate synthetase domain protein [Synechococcus sp. WH 8103]|nr:adenylosuccinate synthetase domain protein [Synechococcus sp. WH 8103]
MACIHTTLVANDHIGGAAEEIGDLSFSFVTPLSSDDDNVGQ